MREVFITPTGQTLRSYCISNGLKYETVYQRMHRNGMSFSQAVTASQFKKYSRTPEQTQFYNKCRKAKVNPALVMIRHKRSGESIDKSIKWYERRNECLKTLRY